MTFIFADSFDPYAAPADTINGYWDSGTATGFTLVAGRFTGSQALQNASNTAWLTKASGSNDAVHHIVCAFRQSAAITGSTLGMYIQLLDGATAQCSIVFRSDGAILLTSGGPAGAALATYTGAFPVTATWYAFEFEVVVNSATGSFTVRKNGNPANDFTLGSLNTRGGTANNYANKLTLGQNATVTSQQVDDLLWRSDASSVSWAGDIRCYTRMPASDASVVFSRSPTSAVQTPVTQGTTSGLTAGTARYTTFTAAYDGAIGTATLNMIAGYTGNLKCSLFASSGTAPTTVLGSAAAITNPATGSNTFTFGTPVSVAKGTQYWIGFDSDTSAGTVGYASGSTGASSTTAYASFPAASPATSANNAIVCSVTIAVSTNNSCVNEPQQDATTSYVFSANPGDADFYGIASISGTPSSVIAVTTRAYAQKSDAGTRTAAVQLKSGGTTVASPTLTLSSSGWLWAYRTDTTDPNTSAAWTPAAVNNVQIGPRTIA